MAAAGRIKAEGGVFLTPPFKASKTRQGSDYRQSTSRKIIISSARYRGVVSDFRGHLMNFFLNATGKIALKGFVSKREISACK
jgi:hypothetical protein